MLFFFCVDVLLFFFVIFVSCLCLPRKCRPRIPKKGAGGGGELSVQGP